MSKTSKVVTIDTIHAAAVADQQYKLGDDATQSVFGVLAKSTMGYSGNKWEKEIREIEWEYCESVHATTEGARFKDKKAKDGSVIKGDWKYRTLLPKAWASSKSVCGTAIELGIVMDGDSRKTATEKAIKEARKANAAVKSSDHPAVPKVNDSTALERVQRYMSQVLHEMQNMPEVAREEILREYGIEPKCAASDFWKFN